MGDKTGSYNTSVDEKRRYQRLQDLKKLSRLVVVGECFLGLGAGHEDLQTAPGFDAEAEDTFARASATGTGLNPGQLVRSPQTSPFVMVLNCSGHAS